MIRYFPAERNGRLGALLGKRKEPGSFATRQYDAEDPYSHRFSTKAYFFRPLRLWQGKIIIKTSSLGPIRNRGYLATVTCFPIIGILIVFGAVVGGYLMEHGKLLVLAQPAELIIIFGAAMGTVVTANPLPTLIRLGKAWRLCLSGSPYTKAFYTENSEMMYDLFSMARKAGTAKLEEDIDNPAKSAVLKKYPKFLKSHHAWISSAIPCAWRSPAEWIPWISTR